MTENKKKPIYILCVDGGGVKGAIAAQFLSRLDTEVLNNSLFDTFDFYGGTSTGAMIVSAIVYGQYSGMDLTETLCIPKNLQRIMDTSILDKMLDIIQPTPKYDGKGKRQVMEENITDTDMKNSNGKSVILSAYDILYNDPYFFKSWNSKGVSILDAIDASSAAPGYFPSIPIYIKNEVRYFIDGGVCANNITDCAYSDALQRYGKDADIRILSIGTGKHEADDDDYNYVHRTLHWGGLQWVSKGNLIQTLMSGPEECVDYRTYAFTKALGHSYLRINGFIENSSIDDVSNSNIKSLKETGDEWFENYKNELLSFFKV